MGTLIHVTRLPVLKARKVIEKARKVIEKAGKEGKQPQ